MRGQGGSPSNRAYGAVWRVAWSSSRVSAGAVPLWRVPWSSALVRAVAAPLSRSASAATPAWSPPSPAHTRRSAPGRPPGRCGRRPLRPSLVRPTRTRATGHLRRHRGGRAPLVRRCRGPEGCLGFAPEHGSCIRRGMMLEGMEPVARGLAFAGLVIGTAAYSLLVRRRRQRRRANEAASLESSRRRTRARFRRLARHDQA